MSTTEEVKVPDIGDFEDVDVIEVLVETGQHVEQEQSLITLESDKATLEVPSPKAGVVQKMHVSVGDKVSEGSLVLTLEVTGSGDERTGDAGGSQGAEQPAAEEEPGGPDATERPAAASGPEEGVPAPADADTDLVVLGSGPGGYTAAFRAADLGLDVTLIERYPDLGGVCLNVGCIPSKALLHAAKVITDAREMADHGVRFSDPTIDTGRLDEWKWSVVKTLTDGLAGLAKRRKVTVIQGTGRFTAPHELEIEDPDGKTRRLSFRQAIVAAGSQPAMLPDLPDDPRIMDSTAALEIDEIPKTLLVVGGGIIGLEMACMYAGLGSRVTIVELTDGLMPGTDPDLVKPLRKRLEKICDGIHTGTAVDQVKANRASLSVTFKGENAPSRARFDCILVSVGRRPNGHRIGADKAGFEVDDKGFIPVNQQMRTSVRHIFAIGDIVGAPLLAHKATHQAKVAAEVAAGERRAYQARVVPAVAYTDPEVAWAGVTEQEAKQQNLNYGKGVFPWAANGRALGMARSEGQTKLLFDRDSGIIIGAGVVGAGAGDLIAELALAIEMGADAEDIALTIHPHPTLSETVGMAAEAYEGTITDLYMPRR
ncbi:MAG TPA: dihydrolipoyl dehydrogenase [Gammaproteobacteria bacterium]|nr:dihydrolipoyl dehydrogenase [Gammaproteobacteria bacterium]